MASDAPKFDGTPDVTNPFGPILVLASSRSFEALTGAVPETLRSQFRFHKSDQGAQIGRLLPKCRLVISKNYRRPETNRWIFEARRLGIPTLLVVDGPLEWSNLNRLSPIDLSHKQSDQGQIPRALFRPIIHDAVASIGNAQMKWIDEKNLDRGLTHFSYCNHRIRTDARPVSSNPDLEFDFLVTTARTPYFDEEEKRDLEAILLACISGLKNSGARTLVRIFDSDLRAAIQAEAPACTFQTHGSFTQALFRSRRVIGTASSVLLEAMHHRRPTGQLLFRPNSSFYETGWSFDRHVDWAAELSSMDAGDAARMDLQRRSVDQNLSDIDFFSTCEKITKGQLLPTPRPVDTLDLDFEQRFTIPNRGQLRRIRDSLARVFSVKMRLDR